MSPVSDLPSRFLGGSPGRTFLQLLVLSLVVGLVLSALDLSPWDLVYWVRDTIARIWNFGFSAIDGLLRNILIGAAVVIPVWLVVRLFSVFGKR